MDDDSEDSRPVVRSYQRGDSLGPAAIPVIEHYGDDGISDMNGGVNGDATILPNRGLANSAEGGGTTLPELVFRMRVLNLALCTVALGLEVPTWLTGIFLDPPKMVLSIYLAGFAGLLCCFELHIPAVGKFIRSNFGLLYSPGGRAAFLFLMGGLCLGQGRIWEYALGAILIMNGFYTLYITHRYPAYQQAFEENERQNIVDAVSKRTTCHSWADPTFWATSEEQERLMAR
eukprot:CAMPEP_0183295174 /NCGR_PEP_ID=MMETSP0160_2-20130417/3229_1 /TAXON_ID=2839 ORGANISM="Odontella Sinensis, Strain Grunow 1884" /NCGR_SAMPLE_ID=MMETSP0160_2 /ASSEMBLY_ACC=CAM_ASM_000250 /LENGTH=230 /DNA_ID=CAMNT_0025456609 /DNA_START=123 /DNA_END=818 /DNA_ORIENTATION=-